MCLAGYQGPERTLADVQRRRPPVNCLPSRVTPLSSLQQYAACSTTARRGALDWQHKFYDANLPVFEELYKSVKDGSETRRSLEFNGRPTYNQDLAKELAEIDAQEIWQAGKTVRSLRPDAREKA